MNRQTANTLGVIFGVLGVLFMLAMAFGVFLPRMYALFLGVACFVIAPAFKRLSV
jgi:multisubunit Na+/H+ antiporter MnhG subunit